MTVQHQDAVADLTALGLIQIGREDIGHAIYVTSEAAHYRAALPGRGVDKWTRAPQGPATGRAAAGVVQAYRRTFDHADTDVALAAVSAQIDLGDALPADAVVIGVRADNTEDWDDGVTAAVGMDVGDGTTDDLFNPTAELDIDGGVAVLGEWTHVYASAVQLTVTITADVNLSTLISGTTELTVYYVVPQVTTEAAP